jgi:hypothetical protein
MLAKAINKTTDFDGLLTSRDRSRFAVSVGVGSIAFANVRSSGTLPCIYYILPLLQGFRNWS